ncbi:S-adenosylmethionine uptake transporter [Meinhardsimonia xiamenensis]|jgi:S-adenosylmethionine uptake transporter|uniref:S-adenosylmethionine uptake transporter n=1 Tax=Meinhardsimonia xiamenensis TaxID=990712 RepID=A0A1G8Z577_9RHOB|nr:DMT family transporter [Meinhardsimonia xiamenensis]PRX37536.1 S-adenosylmethionine uptake transporter [Meinhardsimonia xiamenensis]SDK09555.1 S-adenosylmethionine uptake transporter [Meinhardsimonia xiamenensis]
MALAMFLFAAVDAQGKFLTQSLHPIQIVWTRQLGLLAGAFVLLALRGRALLDTGQPMAQFVRGALAATSATLFITAVAFVPLADAVAISFVAPFIVTLMGAIFLREPVGLRRWAAVIVGFVGTLIVIRPGLGVLHPAAFLVIGAAALFSLRQILSRSLAATDRTETTVAYTAFVGSALLTLPLPFVWRTPDWGLELALLIGMAVIAGVAELMVIKALEIGQAVVVAPVHYSIMIWATVYGWLLFGQLPDFWTWIGAAIIVATGIYTLNRERRSQ